jgi:hypothetical protein
MRELEDIRSQLQEVWPRRALGRGPRRHTGPLGSQRAGAARRALGLRSVLRVHVPRGSPHRRGRPGPIARRMLLPGFVKGVRPPESQDRRAGRVDEKLTEGRDEEPVSRIEGTTQKRLTSDFAGAARLPAALRRSFHP